MCELCEKKLHQIIKSIIALSAVESWRKNDGNNYFVYFQGTAKHKRFS